MGRTQGSNPDDNASTRVDFSPDRAGRPTRWPLKRRSPLADDDVGSNVLGCRVDILRTNMRSQLALSPRLTYVSDSLLLGRNKFIRSDSWNQCLRVLYQGSCGYIVSQLGEGDALPCGISSSGCLSSVTNMAVRCLFV